MERVNVFLRTPLYSVGGGGAHLPSGVLLLEGMLMERDGAGIRIEADRFLDARGRELLEETLTLVLPWEKIDHVLIID